MTETTHLKEKAALIGIGFLAAGAGGGVIGLLARDAASFSDTLGFFGTIIGIPLGIAGAVWQADRNRRFQERADVAIIREALASLKISLKQVNEEAVQERLGGGEVTLLKMLRSEILAILEEVNDTLALLIDAAESAKLPRFADRQAVFRLIREIERHQPVFDNEARIVDGNRLTEGIVGVFYNKAEPAAADLLAAIDTADAALAGKPNLQIDLRL